jgi:hypothetical protein
MFQVELGNGFQFGVDGDVKTLGDVRKLLQKADKKILAAMKAVPEIAEEKAVKGRFTIEQQSKAAASSA